jgi:hypothetical protein
MKASPVASRLRLGCGSEQKKGRKILSRVRIYKLQKGTDISEQMSGLCLPERNVSRVLKSE